MCKTRVHAVRLLLVAMTTTLWGNLVSEALPCDGSPEVLTADYKVKKIYSPGYPDHYENNMECDWLFEPFVGRRPGFGIQLATLEVELDPDFAIKTEDGCEDYLEAFEGSPSNLGRSLGRWCGGSKRVIKSMSNSVTLKFHSNAHYTGKGFVIEYSLVRIASTECLPGRVTPVHIGQTAVYESFEVKNTMNRCTWRMEGIDRNGASDATSAMVIEAFDTPRISCSYGKFVIYDGQDTKSPKVLEWCDTSKAFSTIYLSSRFATLTFIFQEGKELDSDIDPIQLKLYTRDLRYNCENSSLPSINADGDPVYFSLPFARSPGGAACDVHVSERNRDSLRLEVRNVNGQEPTCNVDVVSVKRARSFVNADLFCARRRYPLYLPFRKDIIVGLKNTANRVILRAVSTQGTCGGEVFINQALDDQVREVRLPKTYDDSSVSPPNCYTRLLIPAQRANRAISLHLEWSLASTQVKQYSNTDACEGDFVNIYDGNSQVAPLLFSSCRRQDMPGDFADIKITGTQNEMLVLFDSDDSDEAKSVRLQFHSIPSSFDADECREIVTIQVNETEQNLTSPNYPDFFPLDYTCNYKLTAPEEDDVIVIEVLDTSFSSGCGDIINIYEGQTPEGKNSLIGRICGLDKPERYVSASHEVLVRFSSDKVASFGGWKLKVYSQSKDASGVSRSADMSSAITILLLFVAVAFMKV